MSQDICELEDYWPDDCGVCLAESDRYYCCFDKKKDNELDLFCYNNRTTWDVNWFDADNCDSYIDDRK